MDKTRSLSALAAGIALAGVASAESVSLIETDWEGHSSVGEILERYTMTGAPPLSRAEPLRMSVEAVGTFVNLRNLGANRTLVLLNGRRLGTTTTGIVDVSLIPLAAVERIEIVKDGASSIYGADAIAGVVNIVTRTGYEGMRAGVTYGEQGEGDQETERADFVIGHAGDRGGVTAVFEFFREKPVFMRDRPFSAFPRSHLHPDRDWTVVGQVGGFSDPIPGVRDTFTRMVCPDGCDWRNLSEWVPQSTDPADGHVSNINEWMTLRSRRETRTVYVDGSYDVTDGVRFRSLMMYSTRSDWRQIAGYPFQSGAALFSRPHVLSSESYFNPVGVWHGFTDPQPLGAFPGSLWRRGWEVPRAQERQMDSLRFSASLDGVLDVAGRPIVWDFAYLRNHNRETSIGFGDFNTEHVRLAFGPSFVDPATGLVTCGTPDDPLPRHPGPGGCIPWNPFVNAGVRQDGGLTDNAELHEFLFQRTHDIADNTTQVLAFSMAGPLRELPAGEMRIAAGIEHRKESGTVTPDPLKTTGVSSGVNIASSLGTESVAEIHGELVIPLLRDVRLAESMGISLSARHSDYDSFGSVNSRKVEVSWKPVDALALRGSWNKGFRAPSIHETSFGVGVQSTVEFVDPCDTLVGRAAVDMAVRERCMAGVGDIPGVPANFRHFLPPAFIFLSMRTPVRAGGNPTLEPESSEGFRLGAVWTPGFAPELGLGLALWRIRVDDTIVPDDLTAMLDDCYVHRIDARCRGFTRDPERGEVADVRIGDRNAGFEDARGIDIDLAWRVVSGHYGAFSVASSSSYSLGHRVRADDEPDTLPGHLTGFGGHFRLRSKLATHWEYGDYGASWTIRYHSSMREACFIPPDSTSAEACSHPEFRRDWSFGGHPAPVNKTGSTTFNDVQVRWRAPWDAALSVGADNVFDRHGPVMFSQPNSNTSYYGGFDIGRFWYVRYRQDF